MGIVRATRLHAIVYGIALSSACFGSHGAPAAEPVAPIEDRRLTVHTVSVVNGVEQPLPSVTIAVDLAEGTRLESPTDAQGVAVFEGVRPESEPVTVTAHAPWHNRELVTVTAVDRPEITLEWDLLDIELRNITATTTGLAPGLVHYHFKNKREILLAALDELVIRHDAHLEDRLRRAGGDPVTELATLIDLYLGVGADADADPEALACWILLTGEALREPRVRAELEKALAASVTRTVDVIRRGVEAGVFACDRVDAAAAGLVAAIQGYFVLAATARGTELNCRHKDFQSVQQAAANVVKPSGCGGSSDRP